VTFRLHGYPSESASSSKWHAWFASRCPGRRLVYLADDCRLVSDSTRRSLLSADVSTCVVPPTLSSYGDRSFAAAGPRLWNSLPVQLRNPDIAYGLFRRQLKGHLFREAWTRRSVTSDIRRHRETLTQATDVLAIQSTVFILFSCEIVFFFFGVDWWIK